MGHGIARGEITWLSGRAGPAAEYYTRGHSYRTRGLNRVSLADTSNPTTNYTETYLIEP